MNARSDSSIAAWLALFLFGIYLLSFSGMLYSQDSQSMFSVAESFVKRGELNTDQMWTLFKARNELASDGESYAKYGYGISLVAVPLYALALALPGLGLVQTTVQTSSVVIALSGALLFLAARRLNYSRGVSVLVALLFGLATPAWVYAKQFWSEPYGLFTLLAAFYFLLRYRDTASSRDALIAGIALGLAVATRVTNAALVPVFAWYGFGATEVAATQAQSRPPSATPVGEGRLGVLVAVVCNRPFALFTVSLALVMLSIGLYDWARYGGPFATGYRADETFDNPILLGLYGLLFSPGKGLFIYVPFLAALPFSFAVFFQRARREAVLFLFAFAFYLLTFSLWYYWWGGTNWGPRFLVPTLPFLVLAVAPAVELAVSKKQAAFTILFSFFCLLAFTFELVGVSIPSLAYRLKMLRVSTSPDWDAIFIPQFSPLVGSLDQFKPKLIDFAWLRVTDNAVNIDWLVIGLTLALIVSCGAMIWSQVAGRLRPTTNYQLLITVLAVALALFSLYRYGDDARFGGGDGYRALLQAVEREAQPRDVLILNNDVFTPFFLNENRARLRWYGLSRDPKQWDEATRALLTRLARSNARVWLACDDSAGDLPDPTREWLDQSLEILDERSFQDGVHLVLYATPDPP
ncbi:MAG: hypothetical protein HY782_04955 [Chloroflexi bacterium]|nr:hypothetical protein [Chloroflexota bacterium]